MPLIKNIGQTYNAKLLAQSDNVQTLVGNDTIAHAAISKSLDISIQTVDVHLRNARKKLKVEDTAIALLEAYKRGLIEY